MMNYFCKLLSIPIFICSGISLNAQSLELEEQQIMTPIHLLFKGMEKADTALIRKAFAKNVIMKVVSEKGTKKESLDNFLNQIASKEPGTPNWIEKIYNTEIRMDGHLAHVWTDYNFYVGDRFSHCGVDSFALIKLDDEWKIVYIKDTRRQENCENE